MLKPLFDALKILPQRLRFGSQQRRLLRHRSSFRLQYLAKARRGTRAWSAVAPSPAGRCQRATEPTRSRAAAALRGRAVGLDRRRRALRCVYWAATPTRSTSLDAAGEADAGDACERREGPLHLRGLFQRPLVVDGHVSGETLPLAHHTRDDLVVRVAVVLAVKSLFLQQQLLALANAQHVGVGHKAAAEHFSALLRVRRGVFFGCQRSPGAAEAGVGDQRAFCVLRPCRAHGQVQVRVQLQERLPASAFTLLQQRDALVEVVAVVQHGAVASLHRQRDRKGVAPKIEVEICAQPRGQSFVHVLDEVQVRWDLQQIVDAVPQEDATATSAPLRDAFAHLHRADAQQIQQIDERRFHAAAPAPLHIVEKPRQVTLA
eukprot:scaffold480_cov257-Pinguiococcus_pyrenoidosus.AAC.2